ncbi:MAG: hypothetical protein AAF697_13685 [Pseudomonadota bacterium]
MGLVTLSLLALAAFSDARGAAASTLGNTSLAMTGYYNGANAECNLIAAGGGWRMASTTYRALGGGNSYHYGSRTLMQIVYDPDLAQDVNLDQVWAYEMYHISRRDRAVGPFPFFTGTWPRIERNKWVMGREAPDEPLLMLNVDPGQLRLALVVPNAMLGSLVNLPINYDDAEDTITDERISGQDTALVLKIGEARYIFKADKNPLYKTSLTRLSNTLVQDDPQATQATVFEISVPTYTRDITLARTAAAPDSLVEMIPSQESDTFARLLEAAGQPGLSNMIFVADGGAITHAQQMPDMDQLYALFLQGINHYGAHFMNRECRKAPN